MIEQHVDGERNSEYLEENGIGTTSIDEKATIEIPTFSLLVSTFKEAYTNYLWFRLAIYALLLLCGLLFYWFSDGFPPWAWRFFFSVLPRFPALLQAYGFGALVALLGLTLLSITLLILWTALVFCFLQVVLHAWYELRRRQSFTQELREVELIANSMVETERERELQQQEQHGTEQELAWEFEQTEQRQSLRYVVGIGTDPGIARKNKPNEDSLFAMQGMYFTTSAELQPTGLFIVADGMGGHSDGMEASRLAVQVLSDVVWPALLHTVQDTEMFSELLKDGVHRANLALYQRNRQREHMMGTTITAVLVVGTTAYIVNAGDSRTYIYRQGEGLSQVTRDHSQVARMVEAGAISQEDIYTHPQRNQIYRCLGDTASISVDSFELKLNVGDIVLLCSDGLWEMVRNPTIETILKRSQARPSQACELLIQAALDNGGADNVSVVVARLIEE